MTQACKKQVEQATAEYKIKLKASDNEIQQLKSKDQIKDAKLEVSDNEIKELKNYKHDSQIEIQKLKEQNIVLTKVLTKAGLL